MAHTSRRSFLAAAAQGAGAMALAGSWRSAASRTADSRIEILLGEPIGTIAPEIYGHFIEHLGGVIYDGVWVGENSRVPNVRGIRRDLVDALRRISPAVMRWPGGCFADAYDWRDGIGPAAQRPRRTNVWAEDDAIKGLGNIPQRFDPNTFGTNEFMRFCRLVGAQPYVAANVRSLPAHVFFDWLDYCNAPDGSSTLADQRAAGGDRDPFNVRFWGIGNESWGCGGNFRPEEYAEEFRRFTTWSVPDHGLPLAFIASGPSGADPEWTRRFFAAVAERNGLDRLWGWALHHYASAGDAGADAVAFDDRGWFELLANADRMESLILMHWPIMRMTDRDHRVKLVVDEWGAWHANHPLVDPSHLFESQSTIRDALVASLTLDTFHRHADKIAMANVAQLINCIHSLFFAHEDKFVTTPSYHVFDMYAVHQGAQAVRSEFSAPSITWADRQNHPQTLWGLAGSASRKADALTVTVTNPHLSEPRETEIAVRGATVRSARAVVLQAHSVHDVNTFEQPAVVAPAPAPVTVTPAGITFHFPPASVVRMDLQLG